MKCNFYKGENKLAVVDYGTFGGVWVHANKKWLDKIWLDRWDKYKSDWTKISRQEAIKILEKITGREFLEQGEINISYQTIPVPVQDIFNLAKELELEEGEKIQENISTSSETQSKIEKKGEAFVSQTIFSLYLGEDGLENLGIFIGDDIVAIEDLVEGESPIEVYRNDKWATYYLEELPEDLSKVFENSNMDSLSSRWCEEGLPFKELPKNIKAILKKHFGEKEG